MKKKGKMRANYIRRTSCLLRRSSHFLLKKAKHTAWREYPFFWFLFLNVLEFHLFMKREGKFMCVLGNYPNLFLVCVWVRTNPNSSHGWDLLVCLCLI